MEQSQSGQNPKQDVPKQVQTVKSVDLFRGQTELRLLHEGEEYRLRITRQGKLILTK